MSVALRERPVVCVCDAPHLYRDDDGFCCMKCGHPRVDAGAPRRNGSGPVPGPNLRIAADAELRRPAAGGVPWTEADEQQLRELVQATDATPWAIGDLALELIPVGSRGHSRGVFKLVAELAERVGFEGQTLKQYRTVSSCWPPKHRVAGATHGAHAAHLNGGRGKAHNRAVLLHRLVADRGKCTADLVREARSGRSEPVTVLAVRFTPEQRKRLDALAEAEGRSRGALVRQALDEYLERAEGASRRLPTAA